MCTSNITSVTNRPVSYTVVYDLGHSNEQVCLWSRFIADLHLSTTCPFDPKSSTFSRAGNVQSVMQECFCFLSDIC